MSQQQYEEFHLGDILSITTGLLLSPTHMDGIYRILNFLTADNLFTHQIPRAMKECQPFLLAQFPQFAAIDANHVTPENHAQCLAQWVQEYGERHLVQRMPSDLHHRRDALEELQTMVGKEKVIVIARDR